MPVIFQKVPDVSGDLFPIPMQHIQCDRLTLQGELHEVV
jgi:hypothetical protein